jgi:hypothetical protein
MDDLDKVSDPPHHNLSSIQFHSKMRGYIPEFEKLPKISSSVRHSSLANSR